LKSIPFLRILLPYLAGIFYVQHAGIFANLHIYFLLTFVLLAILFLVQKYHRPLLHVKKVLHVVLFNTFLFLLAFEACFSYDARNEVLHYTHYMASAHGEFFCRVNDLPVNTGKFTKVPVEINGIRQNGRWHYVTGYTVIYLQKDISQMVSIGNSLYVSSAFTTINPPQNPGEFDYRAFQENKNRFHVVYADSSNVYQVPEMNHSFSWLVFGCRIKEKVVSALRHAGLSQEAFSICTALLVGYDDEIEDSVLSSFSHSGTLHVLSVSGMHTGIVYLVLMYLFQLFDKHNRYKWMRWSVIILTLVLFALITGFSPSVLRAVLMLVLIITGKTAYRQGNSYNTLLLSAFLLLLYNPMLVKDVGFLLSYFAVFGIMYLYPLLDNRYVVKNKILGWFWSLTLMSVAATVFTLPVSLYYFHQFPLWFVFSNLIIIPVSIGLMGAAALVLVFYKIAVITKFLALLINFFTSVMLWFAQLTDKPGYGFIDYISFSKSDAIFCATLIIMVLWIMNTRQYKAVIICCMTCVVWTGISLVRNYVELQQEELVVFSIKHKQAYILRIGHTVYANTGELSEKEYGRFVKPYLLGFSGLQIIPHKSNLTKSKNAAIFVPSAPAYETRAGTVNYIIISHNWAEELNSFQNNKPLIIADCSNSYKFVKKLKERCALLGLPFYSVKEQGALQIQVEPNITER